MHCQILKGWDQVRLDTNNNLLIIAKASWSILSESTKKHPEAQLILDLLIQSSSKSRLTTDTPLSLARNGAFGWRGYEEELSSQWHRFQVNSGMLTWSGFFKA